jgi:hypothetical protein
MRCWLGLSWPEQAPRHQQRHSQHAKEACVHHAVWPIAREVGPRRVHDEPGDDGPREGPPRLQLAALPARAGELHVHLRTPPRHHRTHHAVDEGEVVAGLWLSQAARHRQPTRLEGKPVEGGCSRFAENREAQTRHGGEPSGAPEHGGASVEQDVVLVTAVHGADGTGGDGGAGRRRRGQGVGQ